MTIRRKACALLAVFMLLAGCAAPASQAADNGTSWEVSLPKTAINVENMATAYKPSKNLTMKETISEYFEQQYLSYTSLQYRDISYFLDMDQVRNQNTLTWLKLLIQRRRLLKENKLCYVDTKKYAYKITYNSKAEDSRMSVWKDAGIDVEGETFVHFTITGVKGKAYPPFMAVNSQHTLWMKKIDGQWKIVFHYYPGSARRYSANTLVSMVSEKEMLKDLKKEFASTSSKKTAKLPENAYAYNGERAAAYATRYAESANPNFYKIGDWVGNCANFTSQCVWYGFGNKKITGVMTKGWYGGAGGGSPSWENVMHFWTYATANYKAGAVGMRSEKVSRISGLKAGGIIQTRLYRKAGSTDRFGHNYILVNEKTLLLAQNSPNNFMYYSDMVNVETRMLNPLYIIKEELPKSDEKAAK